MPRFHDRLRFPFKYDGIRLPRRVPKWILAPQDLAQVDFDLSRLGPRGPAGRMRQAGGRWVMRGALRLLQRFWPRCRIGNLLILTRHADVTYALHRPDIFANHYEPEMRLLSKGYGPGGEMETGDATFMLAIDDVEAHGRQQAPVAAALSESDLVEAFTLTSERVSKALLRNGGGRIDVMKDYFTRVSAEAGLRLLGLEVDDPDSFADWTLAMSTMIFGDPFGRPVVRELGQHAAWRMRATADRAIALAESRGSKSPQSLVAKLVRHRFADGGKLGKEEIRAILIGTAIGLVPTVTLAAGNVIEWLLKHPKTLAKARKAAKRGDDVELCRIIMEVARLTPALDPGQFRFVDRETTFALPSGLVHIPAGTVVLASTARALRDPRVFPKPGKVRLDRPAAEPSLMFGAGMHGCMGWKLALSQMTVMFRHLLSLKGLEPVKGKAGRVERVGPFPRSLEFRYDDRGQGRAIPQSMTTIVVPLPADDPELVETIEEWVRLLGNPAGGPMREALDRTGIVHFCSLSLLDVGSRDAPDPRLILEISADGEESEVLEAIAAEAPWEFKRIFTAAGFERAQEGDSLESFLARHRLDVRPRPWGTSGLLYNGTAGAGVAAKCRQEELARFATDAVQFHMQNRRVGDSRPMGVIRFIRDLMTLDADTVASRMTSQEYGPAPAIGRNGRQKFDKARLMKLSERAAKLTDMLYLPSRDRLAFLDWQQLGLGVKIRRYLDYKSAAGVTGALVLALATVATMVWLGLAGGADMISAERTATAAKLLLGLGLVSGLLAARLRRNRADRPSGRSRTAPLLEVTALSLLALVAFVPQAASLAAPPAAILGAAAAVVVLAVLVALSLCGLTWFAAFLWLRRLEETDRPDERDPDLETRRYIATLENARGHEQNHILSCSDFKPGILRRLTFALAMWGIGLFCRYWTRPGFILSMGTIHFARWLRLPGAAKLIFMSNYDGSWESYLEDFITKAHPGQTAAWTHGKGFPKTKALTREGARNGDRFKRWVRRQQRPTHFWYSRFPDLTLDRIRTNALIHEGLARAATDTRARDWLSLFGSSQRPESMIETHEVQTLLFRGLPRRPLGAYMRVNLGNGDKAKQRVLGQLLEPGKGASRYEGPAVTFGDLQSGIILEGPVLALGLTRGALEQMDLPGEGDADGLASFPLPFLDGMRSRNRILGDEPDRLTWSDLECDAVLILLDGDPGDEERGEDDGRPGTGRRRGRRALRTPEEMASPEARERLKKAVAQIDTLLRSEQGCVIETVFTEPPKSEHGMPLGYNDHFGFRDGLSQPAIRGTSTARRSAPNDVVEPGEFILGYRSNQGYVAPPLRIRADLDPADHLPDTSNDRSGNYPAFRHGQSGSTAFRDFGRNGSYLIIRQVVQDRKAFDRFAESKAEEIRARYKDIQEVLKQPIDAAWLQAKMVGRWQEGTPLIDRADPTRFRKGNARNDFSFATDDPRGFGCPLGAHIRRANPRDSLDWDDPRAITIANRHRMLRRGRHYEQDGKRGLMFTAICGDIERQFEFVMQRWLGGRSFHGLDNEVDPLTASGKFTIPTVVGPVTIDVENDWVRTVGGGYFFLPSRAALRYLADQNRPSRPATPKPKDKGPLERSAFR